MRSFGNKGRATILVCGLAAAGALCGCSNTTANLTVPNPSAPQGLPNAAAPGPVNTYSGVQGPGLWTITLDNSSNTFSYEAVTYPLSPNTPVTGSIKPTHGFLTLGPSGGSGGYALEVLGRMAIFRPGDENTAPVLGVPQTSCYQILGRSRFQYVAIPSGLPGAIYSLPTYGNGGVVASTDSSGKSWQFEDMQGNVVSGPASFIGTCGSVNAQTGISFTGQSSILNNEWSGVGNSGIDTLTAPTISSIFIGPSGFFVADQSDPTTASPTGGSVVGVIQPSAPVNITDITSHQYLGFLYQGPTSIGFNGAPATPARTLAVSLGQAGGTGGTLLGGDFPKDDVTTAPNSDLSIALGKQDATYAGLYASVSITVSDPAQNCANYTGGGEKVSIGVDAQGYPTCTFSGAAVVGDPEGKFGIFINSYNWAARLGGVPMQIYLLQQ